MSDIVKIEEKRYSNLKKSPNCGTKDGYLEVNTVYQMFQKVAKLLGRNDISTHTLRKTFGYNYYKKTKD